MAEITALYANLRLPARQKHSQEGLLRRWRYTQCSTALHRTEENPKCNTT